MPKPQIPSEELPLAIRWELTRAAYGRNYGWNEFADGCEQIAALYQLRLNSSLTEHLQ